MEIIKDLDSLIADIQNKKKLIEKENELVSEQIKKLIEKGLVKLDEARHKEWQKTVDGYLGFLANIVNEVERRATFFKNLSPDEKTNRAKESSVKIDKQKQHIFEAYVKQEAALTKKFIKKIQKDTNVGYSRLVFTLETQKRNLAALN